MKTNLLKTNLMLLALLLISSGMMAQRAVWQPGGDANGSGVWDDPANWDTGELPGTTADGRAIFRGGEIFVNTDVSAEALGLPGAYRLELGDNNDQQTAFHAKLTIEDGGHVGALRVSTSDVGFWAPATLIVEEGGSIELGEHLWIGSRRNYREGTVGQSAVHLRGTMTIHSRFGIDFHNDKENSGGTLFMEGGTLILTSPAGWSSFIDPNNPEENMSIGKNGKIEYTSGLIQLAGNHKQSLEAYDSIGRITGDFMIWTEIVSIGEIADSEGIMVPDTIFVTKLSNEGPVDAEEFSVTFNVDMSTAEGFDPATDVVYITGTMFEWAEPGTQTDDQTLTRVDESMIWTKTLTLEEANYEYKYFINAGWDGGEWAGGDNRVVEVAEDLVVDDIWGDDGTDDGTSVTDRDLLFINIYPNPATSHLYISHDVKIERVEIYNITGSRVLSLNNITTDAIDISDLNSGLYIISVIDVNNNNIVRKFNKQ